MINIVATIYHILRLKCTKFDFGSGPTSKGRGEEGGKRGRGGREGYEGEVEGGCCVMAVGG